MVSDSAYGSPRALSDALSQLVRESNASGLQGNQIRTQFFFERFLSRVFSGPDKDQWMLAGGTSLLARVATTRATKDIDLISTENSLEYAEQQLMELVAKDLGDFVSFEFSDRKTAVEGDTQPYANGVTLRFTPRIGAQTASTIKVDLIVRPAVTGTPVRQIPQNKIELNKKLTSFPYQLFPVVDQVADKICASQQKYGSGADSSREKDLIDLIVLACTQTMEATELSRAITVEARRRKMEKIQILTFPSNWKQYFEKEAQKNPVLDSVNTFETALELMDVWILPVLGDQIQPKVWNNEVLAWI